MVVNFSECWWGAAASAVLPVVLELVGVDLHAEAGAGADGELSNFLDMRDDLLTEPLEIRDGELTIRPGAGIGVEIDPDKLRRYRTD